MITAFANAQIQGVDRLVRAFGDSPIGTSLKIAGGITLPSALLWWANHDDSRWKDIPNWQKDLFWIVMTDKWEDTDGTGAAGRPPDQVRMVNGRYQVNNGAIYRIPKPFEAGVLFGSGVERALDAFFAARPDAYKGFSDSVASALLPSFAPTAMIPVIEQFANRSTFTQRTLIPAPMEHFLPEYQYSPYTTETAKALGHLMGAFPGVREQSLQPGGLGGVASALSSPILMENYLRAWTGNLGIYALQAADAGLRKAGVLPDPVMPASTLADIPFVRAFVVRYPTSSAQSIQDFYDTYDHNKRFFDTWNAMARDGNTEAMRRIEGAGGRMMFLQMDGIRDVLSEQSKIIQDVYKNPDIKPEEKRQLIDTTYWRMSELAHAGNTMLRRAQESLSVPAH